MNRRRHVNAVPLASIAIWIVVATFACATGLAYVYCKNDLHATGVKIKALEKEYAELMTQNEVVRSKINLRSSRAELQRRLAEGFIKLVPITDDRIVRVGAAAAAEADELRAVANERSAP